MWLKEASFYRSVTINVIALLIVAFVLAGFSKVPFIFKWVQEIAVELQTASYNPETVLSLQQEALRNNQPEKALIYSQDIASVDDADDLYSDVMNMRKKAEKLAASRR